MGVLRRLLLASIASWSLGGCAAFFAPAPALESSRVAATIENQALVLNYLIEQSGSRDFLTVAKWGFNVGRQDCELYLDSLFRLNRAKQRNNLVLSALNTVTAAIVTATTKDQAPLSILAAVFGFSTSANNAVSNSFLFTEAPGLISIKVKQLQDAYRESVEKDPYLLPDYASVYNAIQNYYHICLPHAIEGVLLKKVAESQAVVEPPTRATAGANHSLGLAPPGRSLRATSSSPRTLNATPLLQ